MSKLKALMEDERLYLVDWGDDDVNGGRYAIVSHRLGRNMFFTLDAIGMVTEKTRYKKILDDPGYDGWYHDEPFYIELCDPKEAYTTIDRASENSKWRYVE